LHEEEVRAAVFSVWPILALAIPVAGAVLAALAGEARARLRNWVVVVSSGATLVVAFQMMVKVFSGSPVYFNLDIMRIGDQFVCNLGVDALGAFFCFFAAVLWFAASLHAFRYMDHEQKRTRFFFFMMLTEAATLGVFMVQDFFSLYLFFEIMGLAAYVLVVHSETPKARSAATKYICMTVVGGLSLIGGILLYLGYAGTVSFQPALESAWLTGSFRVIALVCLIAGFGVKAGMVPLHIWLPDAHPAAPSPASALLSGVMIKAGAYGIIRTCLTFFQQPPAQEAEAQVVGGAGHSAEGAAHGVSGLASNLQALGIAIIAIAVITMFVGMLLALVQNDIKRTLAYSSVSQMGYILFGVGCMTFLGAEGAIGLGGSLEHIINHAFFKGCFFLAAGAIVYCTHELDMFKLGGLWKRMPLTTVFWCIAALGIMGITAFNGFVSKTLLHHAIVEAHHLAGVEGLVYSGWVKLAEIMFIITSGGTIAYITKMTYYTFFRRPDAENAEHLEHVKEAPAWMLAGIGILAGGVLFLGLFPGFILSKMIVHPLEMVPGFNLELVEHVAQTPIFIWGNIKELLIPLLIGVSIFLLGAWPDLFHARRRGPDIFAIRLPRWLGVDYWYVRGARDSLALLFVGQRFYAPIKSDIVAALKRGASGTVHMVRDIVYPSLTERPLGWARETTIRIYGDSRAKLMPAVREYQGDIAVGALVIAVALALFLIMKLM
jgi:hydrogenase-4 component B